MSVITFRNISGIPCLRGGSHDIARLFDHLMSKGKVNMALVHLAEDSKGGLLSLHSSIPLGIDSSGNQLFCSVRDIVFQKHPHCRNAASYVLFDYTVEKPCYDSVIFLCLTSDVIKWATIHAHGAAGPSGVDADAWHRCVLPLVMLPLICVMQWLPLLTVFLSLQLTLLC